jgi:hypothetical protein
VIEAGCNAHARRKFRDAEGAQPLLAVEGGPFLGAIYGEEEKAKQLGLRGDALRAYRRQHMGSIAHKAALLRFLDDPDIPIDNSPTERVPERR